MGNLHVRQYTYYDADTGAKRTAWDVMNESPESVKNTGAWGEHYLIARYGDKAVAEEHARTGRKPYGYG